MKYLNFINEQIRSTIEKNDNLVLFGQNISAGSCLGGLTKNLKVNENSKIINSTNSENSLCGFGFGMMMNNVSSVFFMKQLDFLLLGIDHLVNTYNIIRNVKKDLKSSFTIIPIIVDNGFQGPQSSFNNFGDICSIARIKGYAISTKFEAEKIISKKLFSPGFRIIGVSQRLFKDEIMDMEPLYINDDISLIQYKQGKDVTIVCFNFSFKHGLELSEECEKEEISSSLFNVTSVTPISWDKILVDAKKTKNLVIIDDSKSENVSCDNLASYIAQNDVINTTIVKKVIGENWLDANSDEMKIDMNNIIKKIRK
jgi:pyruvate dehydrogenase E1 component beta subunit